MEKKFSNFLARKYIAFRGTMARLLKNEVKGSLARRLGMPSSFDQSLLASKLHLAYTIHSGKLKNFIFYVLVICSD